MTVRQETTIYDWFKFRLYQVTEERLKLINHYDELQAKHPHYRDRKILGMIRSLTVDIEKIRKEMEKANDNYSYRA